MNILISACLLGLYCRYDGKVKTYEGVAELLQREDIHLIPMRCARPNARWQRRNGSIRPRRADSVRVSPEISLSLCYFKREESVLWQWTNL